MLLRSLTGIFGKLISVNAASLVWFRVAISSILLYVILKLTGRFKHYTPKEMAKLGASGLLPTFFYRPKTAVNRGIRRLDPKAIAGNIFGL